MTKNVYFEINLECKQVPGRLFGDWFWSDGGNPVNALPPCKVSSFLPSQIFTSVWNNLLYSINKIFPLKKFNYTQAFYFV
jgi:hypothetical protein